jgi:hypothetical protein
MKIELTEKERANLIVFLQRVNLTGAEVPAYVEIVSALNKPFLDKISDTDNQLPQ